ncbi:MAG: endolytic transglycosylase MltG [Patescibacteria group bacterium]
MLESSWRQSQSSWRGRVQIIALFIVMFVIVVGVVGWQFSQRAWYAVPDLDAPASTISVMPGERFAEVATDLDEKGVADAWWLRVYVRLFDDATVYPGDYQVVKGSSYQDIMVALHGAGRETVRITIPEGFTLQKMGERIHNVLADISIESWNTATAANGPFATDPFVITAQKPSGVDLEGYLFPDTYEFATDATAVDIVRTMLGTMQAHIETIGPVSGDAAGMTIHEVLTLASIVEREVRTPEAMQNVADIFLKRLDTGIALQSDATVNYIIDGDDPSPTFDETRTESPYNTYLHAGLPPGPIASPGLNALTAVFHPASNSYYYFLTTDVGDIYYAETFDGHISNKLKYLK